MMTVFGMMFERHGEGFPLRTGPTARSALAVTQPIPATTSLGVTLFERLPRQARRGYIGVD